MILLFQLTLVATDGGGRQSAAIIIVNVARNLFDPAFVAVSTNINLVENFPLGDLVYFVETLDSDVLVSIH